MKTKAELLPLLRAYAQRYGKYTMETDTMSMWWAKLKGEDFDQLKEVFYGLLGNHVKEHQKPFGWKKVLTELDAKFPPEDPQVALDRKWKRERLLEGNNEKQKELSIIMKSLISHATKVRKRGEKFDWLLEYAQQFVEILGIEDAERQIDKIEKEPTNGTEDRLIKLVRDNLDARMEIR